MPDVGTPKSSTETSKLNNDQSETTRFIFRVLILGSILIGLNCYVIISSENRIVWQLTAFSIFPTVLFTLFMLSGINLFLKRNDSKLALRNSEIAVLYVMISVSTTLAGQDLIRQLVPLMANPFWYATPENEWEELFFHYLPTYSDQTLFRLVEHKRMVASDFDLDHLCHSNIVRHVVHQHYCSKTMD